MSWPVLSYEGRDRRGSGRRRAIFAASIVIAVAVLFGVLKERDSAPAGTDSSTTVEAMDVYGLASGLTEFTNANGGNYPSRLEQLPRVRSLNRGRGVIFIGVWEDGRSLEYRVGTLTVVYFGRDQDAPESSEVLVVRATSSLATSRFFEIVSRQDDTGRGPVTNSVHWRSSAVAVESAQ